MSEFDPVSDFLSREQEALGDLTGELDLDHPPVKNEDPFTTTIPTSDPVSGSEFVMLNGDATEQNNSGTSLPTTEQNGYNLFAPSFQNGFAPEPTDSSQSNGFRPANVISDTWCEEFNKRLIQKDEEEEKKLAELQDTGARELENWYKQYKQQLQLRSSELREKRNEPDSGEPRTSNGLKPTVGSNEVWDQVCNMCDFQGKQKAAPDLSRMRGILLSLKSST